MRDYQSQAARIRDGTAKDYWTEPSRYWQGGGDKQGTGDSSKPKYMQSDFETYSEVDIAACGSYRYIEDPSFEPLLLAVAFDDEEPFIIDLANGEDVPDIVWAAIYDDSIIKTAWNAQFERTVFGRMAGHTLSPDSWRCTMVWAAELSLPLKLKTAAAVLKVAEQKDDAGERLIRYFSIPCKPTKTNGGRTRNLPSHDPADWERFKSYCLQDVRTERSIRKKLESLPLPGFEWDYYHMDQHINDRGVMIDGGLVRQAIQCDAVTQGRLSTAARQLTGLENPNSVTQLKSWLETQGLTIPSLGKKDVAAAIEKLEMGEGGGKALDLLKLRLQMAKSSVKKYEAAERCMCSDSRAHGLFQFAGANRTGRFAGRLLQIQNLPQNHIETLDQAREMVKAGQFELLEQIYGNTPDILSQLIRTMLIPKPGCEFIVADFSAIEARVLAWEAGEEWVLDAFRSGQDLYCATASQMFGVPVVKHGVNGDLRQKGKIATLACGYGGSVGALTAMGAIDMGLKAEELPEIIDSWRKANPKIVQYWWDLENAAVQTVKDHQERSIGRITFQFYSNTLWMVLPSGRKLVYISPKLQPNRFGRMSITFMGTDEVNKWSRIETYSGKITENATQSIARDLLVGAMWRIERVGLNIVGHVHDEVIIEVPIGSVTVDEVCQLMSQNPSWAEGLPLAAAGYLAPSYYFKD